MADPFNDALTNLMEACPGVSSATFADLDGEDIAANPRSERDMLRLCAAYGGIALRRLSATEAEEGRGRIRKLALYGTEGHFLTVRVGDDYQLVMMLKGNTPPSLAEIAARDAVTLLEANI